MGFFAYGTKPGSYYSVTISVIAVLSIFPIFAAYFWFRNEFLKVIKYGQKDWLAGFKAGVLVYLVWFILLFSFGVFDALLKWADLTAFGKQYTEKGKNFEQEQKRLNGSFIQNPKSTSDLELNANKMNEFLAFLEQRNKLSLSMLNIMGSVMVMALIF